MPAGAEARLEERRMDREEARAARRDPEPAVGGVVVEQVERLAHRDREALLNARVELGRLPADRRVERQVAAEHRHHVVAPALDERAEPGRRARRRRRARGTCASDRGSRRASPGRECAPPESSTTARARDPATSICARRSRRRAPRRRGRRRNAAIASASFTEPPTQIAPAVGRGRAGEHHGVVGAEPEDVARAGELGDPEADPGLDLRRLEEAAGEVVRRA